jgi:hypothetical protein
MKPKLKRKQFQLDFVSPLSMGECIDRLLPGGVLMPEHTIQVSGKYNRFRAEVTASPTRFDGALELHPAGTRVYGRLHQEEGCYWSSVGIYGSVILLFFALIYAAVGSNTGAWILVLISTLVPVVLTACLFANKIITERRIAAALVQWIDDRLNVERDDDIEDDDDRLPDDHVAKTSIVSHFTLYYAQ